MARELGDGVKALQTTGESIFGAVGNAFNNLFGGTKTGGGAAGKVVLGLGDRAAGAAALAGRPIAWILNRKYLGPLTLVGGAALAGKAVLNHYEEKREAVNQMGFDPSQPPAHPPVQPIMAPAGHMNCTSPADYAAMQARMKDSAAAEQTQFAAAEAEKRAAAGAGTPVAKL